MVDSRFDYNEFPSMSDYEYSDKQKRKIELQEKYEKVDGRRIRITGRAVIDDDLKVGDTLTETGNAGKYRVNNHPNPEEHDCYYRVVEVCPDLVDEFKIYYINLHLFGTINIWEVSGPRR